MKIVHIIVMAHILSFAAIPSAILKGAAEPPHNIIFNDQTNPELGRSYVPQNPLFFNKQTFATTEELSEYMGSHYHMPFDILENIASLERFLQDEPSKMALLATGNANLEYNVENTLLGIGTDGNGRNLYGQILMRIRGRIRSGQIIYVPGIGTGEVMDDDSDDEYMPLEYAEPFNSYAKLLLRSARKGDLKGVQLALKEDQISPHLEPRCDNNVQIPPEELGNTVFYNAAMSAAEGYEKIRLRIIGINKSRNQGINKLIPAHCFDDKIRKLNESKTQFDNLVRLIKIFHPDTAVLNKNGEHFGAILAKIINRYPASWHMLFEILVESQQQSLEALQQAGIIERRA